jgi:hypothetical protein
MHKLVLHTAVTPHLQSIQLGGFPAASDAQGTDLDTVSEAVARILEALSAGQLQSITLKLRADQEVPSVLYGGWSRIHDILVESKFVTLRHLHFIISNYALDRAKYEQHIRKTLRQLRGVLLTFHFE